MEVICLIGRHAAADWAPFIVALLLFDMQRTSWFAGVDYRGRTLRNLGDGWRLLRKGFAERGLPRRFSKKRNLNPTSRVRRVFHAGKYSKAKSSAQIGDKFDFQQEVK
jgi:hypothetical protein